MAGAGLEKSEKKNFFFFFHKTQFIRVPEIEGSVYCILCVLQCVRCGFFLYSNTRRGSENAKSSYAYL